MFGGVNLKIKIGTHFLVVFAFNKLNDKRTDYLVVKLFLLDFSYAATNLTPFYSDIFLM